MAAALSSPSQCNAAGQNPVPSEIHTSPYVAIDSSPPKWIGRQARVFKRKGNRYMPPCSPESPILQMQKRRRRNVQDHMSASLVAQPSAQNSLAQTHKMRAKALRAFQAESLLRSQSISLPASWSPAFPVAEPGMNLCLAPAFNPSEKHTSSFSQLLSLDILPAIGLAEHEFWKLFSRCAACHNFMTTRTVPYHRCPGSETKKIFDVCNIPKTYFMRHLDAHDTAHEAGVPEEIFRAIFYTCERCGRYMTKRISVNHNEEVNCDEDDKELTILQFACAKNLFNTRSFRQIQNLKGFPALELL